MLRTAVFPGSFDPITLGHVDIARRALPLFDWLIIAIGQNAQKQCMFPLEQRTQWIAEAFKGEKKISVESYEGLTVDFCRQAGAGYIVRGLRSAADFSYEQAIAQMNRALEGGIETVFLPGDPKLSAINSSIVRDIIRNGGDARPFLPDAVKW